MDKTSDNSPADLWNRRSNTRSGSSKLTLPVNKVERSDPHEAPSGRRIGSLNTHSGRNPSTTPVDLASPKATSAASSQAAFGLGSGAFGFGNASKTPKTPGATFDIGKTSSDKKDSSDENTRDSGTRPAARKSLSGLRVPSSSIESSSKLFKEPGAGWVLKHSWIIYYRPPTSRNSDYEKSIQPLCRIQTAQDFWVVYSHLKHPSALPTVSDYHIFKDGIRPVWEDDENKKGGKWTMRLKKGVADRYWEDLLFAFIGNELAEASEEVCGAVMSVRSGEDVISIWTKNDGGRNIKIRETIKRVLTLPQDTNLQWKSHDDSITQRHAVDQARQEKANQDKRRNTLAKDEVADSKV